MTCTLRHDVESASCCGCHGIWLYFVQSIVYMDVPFRRGADETLDGCNRTGLRGRHG